MKTFSLHWSSGVVEEEAQIETPLRKLLARWLAKS